MTSSPIEIKLSLLEMGKRMSGNDNISVIRVQKGEKTIREYNYSFNDLDHIPSVLFSTSDVMTDYSSVSSLVNVNLCDSNFPGLV